MKITKEQLAERLHGRQYMDELSKSEEIEAKQSGLVVLFGASDDLAEFRGALYDECGYGQITISKSGKLIETPDQNEMEALKKYGLDKEWNRDGRTITAKWCERKDASWAYETEIPHATFRIFEDDEVYCEGIIFEAWW